MCLRADSRGGTCECPMEFEEFMALPLSKLLAERHAWKNLVTVFRASKRRPCVRITMLQACQAPYIMKHHACPSTMLPVLGPLLESPAKQENGRLMAKIEP